MGGPDQHGEFFRVRSPARLTAGDPIRPWSAFEGLKYVDLSRRLLVEEAVRICLSYPGSFSFEGLLGMGYDEYEMVTDVLSSARRGGDAGSEEGP